MFRNGLTVSLAAVSLFFLTTACGPDVTATHDSDFGSISQGLSQDPTLDRLQARPPFHVRGNAGAGPTGLSPAQVRQAYNLPSSGGTGTIAIVDAFDAPTLANDLAVFSAQFGLPSCTVANGCLEIKKMANKLRGNAGWALETSLDVEWAHAVAPGAKILVVLAKSNSGTDLLAAVDYARGRSDVVAVSMSWGSSEFSGELAYDARFTSAYGAVFFAASGDNGTGVIWPSVSPNVVAVGGTSLAFNPDGTLAAEPAWSGSGGGLSAYEPSPGFQSAYGVPNANGMRSVPDVSYDADPASGFSVYDTTTYNGQKGWFKVGGTSAGSPQWAAIHALGLSATNANLYGDAASTSAASFFRDIVSGTNGSCGLLCTAAPGYDQVTGLGSPLTVSF